MLHDSDLYPQGRDSRLSAVRIINLRIWIKKGVRPISIVIHAANIADSVGAELVFNEMIDRFPRLKAILAYDGYRGESVANCAKKHGWKLNVVFRPDECPKKFIVLPKRWIVERTFSWLEKCRRLTSDFEFFANSAQDMVQIAFIRLMLNRLIG